MASSLNLTDAAKLSHKVQSSLLRSHPKQQNKNEPFYNLKNVISLVSVGCLIGYTLNHAYNKYSNINDGSDTDSDDENIDEFHKKRIFELKKSKCSMYTLPPYYAKHIYYSQDFNHKSNKSNKIQSQPSLTKSLSSLLFTPRKKKKIKKDIFDIYTQKQIILNQIKHQLFEYKHSTKRNLLFISNESNHTYKQIKHFLNESDQIMHINKLLLIPFGHENWDENAKYIEQKMWEIGRKCISIHSKRNMIKLIGQCDGIIVSGGGNTYRLLYYLYHYNLMSILQTVINDGMPFIAIGSGTNIACLTIQTCFDLPIIQPPTFKALSIIPFQLIPKYNKNHNDKQLRLFLKENKNYDIGILALYEDCYLVIKNNTIRLKGSGEGCILYRDYKNEKEHILVGGLLSSLLNKQII